MKPFRSEEESQSNEKEYDEVKSTKGIKARDMSVGLRRMFVKEDLGQTHLRFNDYNYLPMCLKAKIVCK